MSDQSDALDVALYKMIIRKRRNFYTDMVEMGVISREQKVNLMAMHAIRDAKEGAPIHAVDPENAQAIAHADAMAHGVAEALEQAAPEGVVIGEDERAVIRDILEPPDA